MKYRALRNADFALSEIGLGCASYWGKKHFSESLAIDVVHQAVDSGINYFDSGHSYSGGHAEIRLGRALKNHDKFSLIISSKAGTKVGNFGRLYKDFSVAGLRATCELSLKQLKIEHLPMFFLHGPNPEDFNDDVFALLEQLKTEGKIGICGVNSFDDHIIDLTVESKQFQCVMLDYNLFVPHRRKTINYVKSKGLDVIAAGGLGGGYIQKGFKKITSFKQLWYWLRAMKNHRHKLYQAKAFDFLNRQQVGSAVQIALAYALNIEQVSTTLIGTTSAEHLKELIQATELTLSDQLLEQINQVATRT